MLSFFARVQRMNEVLPALADKSVKHSFNQKCSELRKRNDLYRFLPDKIRNQFIRLDAFEAIVLPKLSKASGSNLSVALAPNTLIPVTLTVTQPFNAKLAHVILSYVEILIYILLCSITADALAKNIASYAPQISWSYYIALLIGVGLEIAALFVFDHSLDILSKITSGHRLHRLVKGITGLLFSVSVAFAGLYFSDNLAKLSADATAQGNADKLVQWNVNHKKWEYDKSKAEEADTEAKAQFASAKEDYLFKRWKATNLFVCEDNPTLELCPEPIEGTKIREARRKKTELEVKADSSSQNLKNLKNNEPLKPTTSENPLPRETSNIAVIYMWICIAFSKLLRFILRSAT
jgi:hypothetical protein